MQIFNEEPRDWKDLQDKVAYVLGSCGFNVETPKKIQTVRETIEVDVYAKTTEMTIICECKYWESSVPQSVVLSFRTAVIDIGANKGIIIAKTGFQSGAYHSIQNTNIELKTWQEFMSEYRDKYIIANIKKLAKIKTPLYRLCVDKTEYLRVFEKLDKRQQVVADGYKNELMKVVLLLIPLSFMLQNGITDVLDFDLSYVDEIVAYTGKQLNREFPSYYTFFKYIYQQIGEIVPKLESIYGIKILPNDFYNELIEYKI